MATIHDVARECGVSLTTVSLVLNKRTHAISIRTQERIFEAAKRLNYHPSALARGLMNQRVRILGVVFNTVEHAIVTNPYATGVLSGIFWAAARSGYQVLLFTTPWESSAVSAAAFRDGRTDGLLVIGPTLGSDIVDGIAGTGLPIVVVSAPTPVEGVPSVDIDNDLVGRLAASHLLERGHTRIGQVMGMLEHTSVRQRRDGFLATLADEGITTPDDYLAPGPWEADSVRERTRSLLSLPERPTAVFCTDDNIAVLVCQTAQAMGLRIPDDLSVVGCDDYPVSALLSPPLTTIRHPLMTVGHTATDLLIRRVEEPGREANGSHILPVELIVRGTTAATRETGVRAASPA